jgi:hypothetical protein
MRLDRLSMLAAATMLAAAALCPAPAAAFTGGAGAALRGALEAVDPRVDVRCYRDGWRGKGYYESCKPKLRKKRRLPKIGQSKPK